mgnify:CR=1 FL=1
MTDGTTEGPGGGRGVPPAHALAEALFATARELRRRSGQLLLGEEVTYERLRLLTVLRDDGDMTMTDMSQRLGVTPRAVTNYAQCLQDGGLLERRPHPRDGRATLLHLTDAGRRRTDQLWNAHEQQIADVVDHLSDQQKTALQDVLDALRQASTRLLARPPAPPC